MHKSYLSVCAAVILTGALSVIAQASEKEYDVAAVIKAEAPGTVFTETQSPVFCGTAELPGSMSYEVKNQQDSVLASGKWNGRGKLNLPVLPCGYYRLTLSSDQGRMFNNRSFAVVVDPEKRHRNPAMVYALDSAQSWLCRPDAKNPAFSGDGNALISELAHLAGVEYTRERLSWNGTEAQKTQFNWQQYLKNAEMLSKYGIKISGMFHDSPKWARTRSAKFPDDLKALHDYTQKLTSVFKGKMGNWEFWNEQDLGFSLEGAWDYTACMKAAYLGFKSGDRELPVVSGAFCNYPLRPYINVAFDNDLADYFDVFNFHTYNPMADYSKIVGDLRNLLAQYDAQNKPIWITECGTMMEGMGKVKSCVPGVMAHSPEQELIVAEFLPKSQIIMQSLGIAKNFFFVLAPYNEQNGNKDWGLLRRDYSVKPGYVAFSTLADQLGAAEYVGPLNLGEAVRAFLYRQPDGSQTVVFWAVSELERIDAAAKNVTLSVPVTLPAAPGNYRLTDFLGSSSAVPATGDALHLTALRYPSYVNGLQGLKPVVALSVGKTGTAKPDKDLSVILKVHFSPDFVINAGKDTVDIKGKAGRMTLEVWNLSNEKKSGTLMVKGGTITGIPASVVVAPWSKTELDCVFTPDFSGKNTATKLEVSGSFAARPISRLTVPVMQLDRIRKTCVPQPLLWSSDPGSWQANTSGDMTITADAKDKAVKFAVKYSSKVDRWVYPSYALQLPQESLRGAFALAFEIKADNNPPHKCILMLEGENANGQKRSHWIEYAAPTAEWSERVVVTSGLEGLEDIKQLKIGMNPKEDQKTYYIRNVRILFLP